MGLSHSLRISEVALEGSEATEEMTVETEKGSEKLWVCKDPIVTEKDVVDAWPQATSGQYQVGIKLSEQGGERLSKVTGQLVAGRDRLAVIIDDQLRMAPVVQSQLGRSFVLSLNDENFSEVADLIQGILGEKPSPRSESKDLPPLPETAPYTKEEYQNLKAEREKVGLFYLDELPSVEELKVMLEPGLSYEEVVSKLGKPTFTIGDQSEDDISIFYELAPEKLPLNPERKQHQSGISITLKDHKLTGWSSSWSTGQRQQRLVNPTEKKLKVQMPHFDLFSGDSDWVSVVEETKIPDPEQDITLADLFDLLSLAGTAAQYHDLGSKSSIQADCDVIAFLGRHLREIAKLQGQAVKGRIPLKDLDSAIQPYLLGGKEVPDPAAKD
ncbi:hypothetical protein Hsar01_01382 [Haloferula sargassicola]|uniref:SecDF P1 head subdomain domain-containing protein n=2 Tax=Haloferula sargassicola TaxID=490096 RepID=A0ABP9UKW2_9BACT